MINDSMRKKGIPYAYSAYSNVIFVNGEASESKTADFVEGYNYDEGVSCRFVFRNGHTPVSEGTLTINGFPVKVYNNQGNLVDVHTFKKPVYSGTSIVEVIECIQPGTMLEMYFQNGAIPCWVLIGNPVVLRHDNYEILADGTNRGLLNHPTGSFYWTHSSDNPKVTFGGGTWEQIKGKFLWAKEDSQTVGSDGGAKTVTLTTNNIPSHNHYYTPSGSITLNSHSHTVTPTGSISVTGVSYTPAGTVSVTPKVTGASYTPAGTVSVTTNPTFSGSEVTTSSDGAHTHSVDPGSRSGQGGLGLGSYRFSHYAGSTTSEDGAHTHTVTAKGTISGGAYSFSGTAATITPTVTATGSFTGTKTTITPSATFSGNSNTTSSVTVTGSFSGTRTTTESTGSTTSFNVMNPYVVEYCWKRTA